MDEWTELTLCGVCFDYFELTGPQGLVPHILAEHPDGIQAAAIKVELAFIEAGVDA